MSFLDLESREKIIGKIDEVKRGDLDTKVLCDEFILDISDQDNCSEKLMHVNH